MDSSNKLRSDVLDGLGQVDALLASLYSNSSMKGVTGNEIAKMQRVAESTRRRISEQTLTVAVMALMKSGKVLLRLISQSVHCCRLQLP